MFKEVTELLENRLKEITRNCKLTANDYNIHKILLFIGEIAINIENLTDKIKNLENANNKGE